MRDLQLLMPSYRATRVLWELVLETLPMSVLQLHVRTPTRAPTNANPSPNASSDTISGQSSKKTSTDWRHYVDMITIQYTEALSEVWLAAWLLTLSNTARGGRQQRILGVLSELVGFHSRPYIDCVLLPHWMKMYQNAYMSAWAEQGLGCRFVLKRGVFIFVCEGR